MSDAVNPLDLLPDFENFAYQIAIMPPKTKVRAWSKLRESERRLGMYKWIEKHIDPGTPRHRVLLNDAVSAFLLSFEATLQFLENQFPQSTFWPWLRQQPKYDVCVRGLRVLRHFEAHVESKLAGRAIVVVAGGTRPEDSEVSCTWKLHELQQQDINRLRNPPLEPADITDWNKLASASDVANIFTEGLWKLRAILEAAESQV